MSFLSSNVIGEREVHRRMCNYIKNFDLSLLWGFLNSKISILILGAILSTIIAWYVLESAKKRSKRDILLNLLYYELNQYRKPKPLPTSTADFQFPCRDKLIWSLLTSDALNPKKDKDLMNSLYNLVGWIENFNYTNNYANGAMDKVTDLFFTYDQGRDVQYRGMYKEKEKLVELLRERYKIK